jgi:hypothetical protein
MYEQEILTIKHKAQQKEHNIFSANKKRNKSDDLGEAGKIGKNGIYTIVSSK